MKTGITLSLSFAALALATGCHRHARLETVQATEPGLHWVASPGAVSVAQLGSNAPRVCTLRTPQALGKGMPGKPGHPTGKARKGKPGGHPAQGKPGAPGAGGGGAGSGPAMLDTLMFRLCEARSNGDISAEQYAASIQELIKTMAEMAKQRATPPPGPSPFGPAGTPPGMGRRGGMGPFGRGWRERDADRTDDAVDDAPEKKTDEPKKDPGKGKGK